MVTPTSDFTQSGLQRNKKKGTATLTFNVPNPGELTASGKGVKAAGAVAGKGVAAGQAQLMIKAKGKKKRKLNETGKVMLRRCGHVRPDRGRPSHPVPDCKAGKKRADSRGNA